MKEEYLNYRLFHVYYVCVVFFVFSIVVEVHGDDVYAIVGVKHRPHYIISSTVVVLTSNVAKQRIHARD